MKQVNQILSIRFNNEGRHDCKNVSLLLHYDASHKQLLCFLHADSEIQVFGSKHHSSVCDHI